MKRINELKKKLSFFNKKNVAVNNIRDLEKC